MPVVVVVVARLLETTFVVGSIGSAAILVLIALEDLKTLLGREDSEHS